MHDVKVLEQICLQWGWQGSNRNDYKKVKFCHNGVWHHNGVHHIETKNCEKYLTWDHRKKEIRRIKNVSCLSTMWSTLRQRIAWTIWPKLKGQKTKKCVAFVQRVVRIEERRLFLSRSIQLQVPKCPIFTQSRKRGGVPPENPQISTLPKIWSAKGEGCIRLFCSNNTFLVIFNPFGSIFQIFQSSFQAVCKGGTPNFATFSAKANWGVWGSSCYEILQRGWYLSLSWSK